MNVFVFTLGFRLNQCESECIIDKLHKNFFNIIDSFEDADLIIVNTCTVTSKAEQKCRRQIRLFSKYAPVIAIGCYARLNSDEIEKLADNVYVWPFSNDKKIQNEYFFNEDTLKNLNSALSNKAGTSIFNSHVRAYLKIQDGCNNECGYCRVRIARGKSISIPYNVILDTAKKIQDNGYKEIVLTGVNLMQYNSDDYFNNSGVGLSDLVERLLNVLNKDVRIRFSSLEPENMSEAFYDIISDSRVQPFFHLPIQSGSWSVLKRVNRKIYPEDVEKVIYKLRKAKNDPFISADFITGLPSEDELAFQQTVDFIKHNSLSALHVFPFSPRPDTPLFSAKDRVSEAIRDKRAGILRKMSDEFNKAYKKRQVGKKLEAIIEEVNNNERYYSVITGNYIKLNVSLNDNKTNSISLKAGDLVNVIIDKCDDNGEIYGYLF